MTCSGDQIDKSFICIGNGSQSKSFFTFYSQFNRNWGGEGVLEAVVMLVIAIMSVTGNLVICFFILKSKTTRTVTNVLVCNMALADIAYCLSAPFVAYVRVHGTWTLGDVKEGVTGNQQVIQFCTLDWPWERHFPLIYTALIALFCFFIPVNIITLSYYIIFQTFRRSSKQVDSKNAARRSKQQKVVRTLVLIVLVFIAMWLPLFIVIALVEYDVSNHETDSIAFL
ncbi:somatostatin receptor type 5-like [Dreissena polymorpha]|uniref:somatostatin receptor type 5-like n=1 Tax=Dreissena polymorpha TaxID=45954 RepID=UPI0022648923|nr:somatostatin receptor type 5-like [Dreissena polymorpha]